MKVNVPVVKFVSPEDKERILKENGINLQSAKCEVCGAEVTLENLGLLKITKSGKVIFICSSQNCKSKSNLLFALSNPNH